MVTVKPRQTFLYGVLLATLLTVVWGLLFHFHLVEDFVFLLPILPGLACVSFLDNFTGKNWFKSGLGPGELLVCFVGTVLFWSLVFWPVIHVVCRLRQRKAMAAKLKSDVK